jgi:hypothetical protein
LIFVVEFINTFIDTPSPRYLLFKRIDTWIDIITIVIPTLYIYFESNFK